jgi:serine protease AprX
MAVSIPRAFVEYILLGPMDDRRQLQDTPVLADVWIDFAKSPDKPLELLITPHQSQPAGAVAIAINDGIERTPEQGDADIAPLQGVVAARLYFDAVLRVVVPMTEWWNSKRIQDQLNVYRDETKGPERLNTIITELVKLVPNWRTRSERSTGEPMLPSFDRYVALSSLILWAQKQSQPRRKAPKRQASPVPADEEFELAFKAVSAKAIFDLMVPLFEQIEGAPKHGPLVWQVSLNRTATPALDRSVASVKADAARGLFSVDCKDIAWAVIDSGIDGRHPAFNDKAGQSRIKGAFDFSNIRKIVSLDNLRDSEGRQKRLDALLHDALVSKPEPKEAIELLTELANDARSKRAIHWELVKRFVEIKPETRPTMSDHGTHVAGIIGASKEAAKEVADSANGMCPDIQLYDFRVLAPDVKETEFAIIAALQFIRYLNARTDFTAIHGANLSLSIPHDVRNYACGGTPVCVECERLVGSGVVVVAAAGNRGFQSFQTKEGAYESYAAFSVTDPGNADGVITVGATHRYSPHLYGVSFFSSRGPTGDGRIKPDLVAPGERIRAPFRDGGWGDLDGTSMAAPHVSGAAAMLMARYSELVGVPRRIKQVLCDSATDLGRERSFQGHGMLDVLRAFQSI